jgi:hypothetical protein
MLPTHLHAFCALLCSCLSTPSLFRRLLQATQHPEALDAFTSIVLAPKTHLSFDEMLEAVSCPVCLAYGGCLFNCTQLHPNYNSVWQHSCITWLISVAAQLLLHHWCKTHLHLVATPPCYHSTHRLRPIACPAFSTCGTGRDDPWEVPIWGNLLHQKLYVMHCLPPHVCAAFAHAPLAVMTPGCCPSRATMYM